MNVSLPVALPFAYSFNPAFSALGIIDMQFRRVKCKYDSKVTFHLEKGCGPNYLALLVKYARPAEVGWLSVYQRLVRPLPEGAVLRPKGARP